MCNLSQEIKEAGRMEEMINTEKERQRVDELKKENA